MAPNAALDSKCRLRKELKHLIFYSNIYGWLQVAPDNSDKVWKIVHFPFYEQWMNKWPLVPECPEMELMVMNIPTHANIMVAERYEMTEELLLLEYPKLECDLFEFLRHNGRGRLPFTLVCKWVWQLVDAVHHLHAHGIYHMDLSTENIMVTGTQMDLMVFDFGSAVTIKTWTYACAGWGKSRFWPPESQRLGQRLDTPHIDAYALGRVIQEFAPLEHSMRLKHVVDCLIGYRSVSRAHAFLKRSIADVEKRGLAWVS